MWLSSGSQSNRWGSNSAHIACSKTAVNTSTIRRSLLACNDFKSLHWTCIEDVFRWRHKTTVCFHSCECWQLTGQQCRTAFIAGRATIDFPCHKSGYMWHYCAENRRKAFGEVYPLGAVIIEWLQQWWSPYRRQRCWRLNEAYVALGAENSTISREQFPAFDDATSALIRRRW